MEKIFFQFWILFEYLPFDAFLKIQEISQLYEANCTIVNEICEVKWNQWNQMKF